MGALGATLSFRFRAGRNISILTWDGNGDMDLNKAAEIYMTKICKQWLHVMEAIGKARSLYSNEAFWAFRYDSFCCLKRP